MTPSKDLPVPYPSCSFSALLLLLLLLPFPTDPRPFPGWSGIGRGMLSLSQSVHAEVFLRRRSARDAFISPVDRFCFTEMVYPLFAVVYYYYYYFLFFVPAIIYLFAPRTVLVGADTHTYTWISCFCDTHTLTPW